MINVDGELQDEHHPHCRVWRSNWSCNCWRPEFRMTPAPAPARAVELPCDRDVEE